MGPLLEALLPQLRQRFPERTMALPSEGKPAIEFAPQHPSVGPIQIYDDGDEFTVVLGNVTHTHFTCHGDVSSSANAVREVVADVVRFLEDLFEDRIAFCGSHEGGGSWWLRDGPQSDETPYGTGPILVWSGPVDRPS